MNKKKDSLRESHEDTPLGQPYSLKLKKPKAMAKDPVKLNANKRELFPGRSNDYDSPYSKEPFFDKGEVTIKGPNMDTYNFKHRSKHESLAAKNLKMIFEEAELNETKVNKVRLSDRTLSAAFTHANNMGHATKLVDPADNTEYVVSRNKEGKTRLRGKGRGHFSGQDASRPDVDTLRHDLEAGKERTARLKKLGFK